MAWNRGPVPSKHAHTKMVWTPEPPGIVNRGRCEGCGQQWKLVESRGKDGQPRWNWVVVAEGSDPGGQW